MQISKYVQMNTPKCCPLGFWKRDSCGNESESDTDRAHVREVVRRDKAPVCTQQDHTGIVEYTAHNDDIVHIRTGHFDEPGENKSFAIYTIYVYQVLI